MNNYFVLLYLKIAYCTLIHSILYKSISYIVSIMQKIWNNSETKSIKRIITQYEHDEGFLKEIQNSIMNQF